MDRNCSWWNPADLGLPPEYILQHEQIHLALFELEARWLDAAIPQLAVQIEATADDPETALARIHGEVDAMIRRRLQDVLDRSRAFDEDTSMGHEPVAQQAWWDRVHAELGAGGS